MGLETWASYSLSDFLLFSDRVYWRMFETYNLALWPAQIGTIGAGLLIIAGLLLQPSPAANRLILLALAAAWAWIAWAFLGARYEPINWAISYVVPLFWLQAALLAGAALRPKPPLLARPRGPAGALVTLIMAFAVAGYPVLAWAAGQGWQSGEVFGLAPDPTAVATLAVTALWPGTGRWLLSIIPLAWCLATGLTLHALGAPHFLAAPVLGLAALVAGIAASRVNRPAA